MDRQTTVEKAITKKCWKCQISESHTFSLVGCTPTIFQSWPVSFWSKYRSLQSTSEEFCVLIKFSKFVIL